MNGVTFKEFRRRSWEEACAEAQAFLRRLPRDYVVSVSHVSESPYARVFVWYQAPDDAAADAPPAGRAARGGPR